VQTARDVVEDRHLLARGAWVDVEHPRRGKTRVPISPIRLHASGPAEVRRAAPLLGQDTDRVLHELLGLSEAELAELHATGVIEPIKTS
jgi:crotonobetainyl-CoA:carnitine CoA-transferase CaiB-like acyl-CoA transferase